MWARVSATYLYPIKACAPLPVAALDFESSGDLRGDRAWVVVDADDRITWQGAIPALSQIIPSGRPDRLAISSAKGDSAALPPPGEGARRMVQSWNGQRQVFDALIGHDAGDAVAELASTIAGQRIRIVFVPSTTHRPNPVHIITDASFSSVTAGLEQRPNLLRFRPNMVLTGEDDGLAPFIEEHVTSLVCAHADRQLVLAVTAPCERCIVVNVDPNSSATDPRYLKAIAAHSQARGASSPAVFGIYARATAAGTLAERSRLKLLTSGRRD